MLDLHIMKLKYINEGHKEDELFDNSLKKFIRGRDPGNINKVQATGDQDKTEQPDRSGNQQAAATNDKDAKDLLGVSGNSRDKQSPTNLVANPSSSI